MFKLKPLSTEAIPAALDKATCYRYLNEPAEAESICLDILEVDPHNQQALMTLILALTDQFANELRQPFVKAREAVQRLTDNYCRNYYRGIVCERRAKVHFGRGNPGSGHVAYDWLRQAMSAYEKALDQRLAGNDDAVLRWNACARMIMNNSDLEPAAHTGRESMLE
jgi:tetratricopeptide (TPR) repeat protein